MRRLSTRLVLSHLAVALVATLTTWAVVRWWAPALFDRSLHAGPGAGMGRGMGGGLRSQFADAVNRSVLVGGLVGVLVAGALAVLLSRRIPRPLLQLGRTARAMADTEARRVRLLSEFAHELRTPLTVATGYLEGMADGIVPADPGHLTLVQDELRRVTRLGADLSSLSRAEEGRLEITPVPCRLDELAAAVAERLRPQADDAGIRLGVDAAPTMVTADPDRLAQVPTNLVGNALRATPAGGRITVVCRPGDAGGAVLSVTDTGAGLSAEELGRIFERFYRAPGAPAGGTGIGLTIARGLVEAHGGTLTAGSGGPGQGATFSVSLP